jgi:hypothetical protein
MIYTIEQIREYQGDMRNGIARAKESIDYELSFKDLANTGRIKNYEAYIAEMQTMLNQLR